MDIRRRWMLTAMSGMIIVFLAVTAVAASSRPLNTPLYKFRIEQASYRMNFLPTERNTFAYTTEKGFKLDYDVFGEYCCGENPLASEYTCDPPCTFDTCEQTSCGETCQNTCAGASCRLTCGGETCDPTACLTCSSCYPICTNIPSVCFSC